MSTEVVNEDGSVELKDVSWWEMFAYVLKILTEKLRLAEPESR
jgi:hypothetical protein